MRTRAQVEIHLADARTPRAREKHTPTLGARSGEESAPRGPEVRQVKEIIAAYSENPENDWNSANYPTLSALRSLTRKLPLKRCLRRERML